MVSRAQRHNSNTDSTVLPGSSLNRFDPKIALAMSIKHKAVNAVIWSGVERLSSQLIRFAIGIILAK
jgi:hypothetical protein